MSRGGEVDVTTRLQDKWSGIQSLVSVRDFLFP